MFLRVWAKFHSISMIIKSLWLYKYALQAKKCGKYTFKLQIIDQVEIFDLHYIMIHDRFLLSEDCPDGMKLLGCVRIPHR